MLVEILKTKNLTRITIKINTENSPQLNSTLEHIRAIERIEEILFNNNE